MQSIKKRTYFQKNKTAFYAEPFRSLVTITHFFTFQAAAVHGDHLYRIVRSAFPVQTAHGRLDDASVGFYLEDRRAGLLFDHVLLDRVDQFGVRAFRRVVVVDRRHRHHHHSCNKPKRRRLHTRVDSQTILLHVTRVCRIEYRREKEIVNTRENEITLHNFLRKRILFLRESG